MISIDSLRYDLMNLLKAEPRNTMRFHSMWGEQIEVGQLGRVWVFVRAYRSHGDYRFVLEDSEDKNRVRTINRYEFERLIEHFKERGKAVPSGKDMKAQMEDMNSWYSLLDNLTVGTYLFKYSSDVYDGYILSKSLEDARAKLNELYDDLENLEIFVALDWESLEKLLRKGIV